MKYGSQIKEYPDQIAWLLDVLSIFLADFDTIEVPADCIYGNSFRARYVFALGWPLCLLLGFALLFVLARMLTASM